MQPHLSLRLAATPESLAEARAEARAWLGQVGVYGDVCHDLVLALSEALANAIEHASDPIEEVVRVTASRIDGHVLIEVVDTGKWAVQPLPDERNRGRGLELIRALVDDVLIRQGAYGTTVELLRRVQPGC